MSLDYVKKGESVKASTVNSLIDAIGGNQRMSPDLNVTTTKNGPQVSLPSNYGGPNHKPNELLDVGRYQLSGWPMTQLLLGPEIDDCLNAIRLHKPDGTVQTSVSAAIVFKNSSYCPTGDQLSGYLLASDQFGYDRERHASGWFQTLIEDPYCGNYMGVQLWQYQDGQKLATVFTNVNDDISVGSTLSSVLQNGGVGSDELSSISKIDAWQLVDSTYLSAQIGGQTSWISTHEHVKNHGQIDVYQSEGQDYRVVLKCSLKCIGVGESSPDPITGETHVESTKWAWSIPLGPDASSEDGKAQSSCVTYGGNPVLFEVEEGGVGDDYDGTATYDNGEITFGLFEAQAGSPVEAGELWLVLNYDYQNSAVMGQFSDTIDSGSYTQDGILSRNVFVISASEFIPSTEEIQVGSKASIDLLTYGTWGVLPKDGPKLDTYCQKDAETEFKSLDWADRSGENVECQCAEIYKFDQLDFTVPPLSTDHIIVRRTNENGNSAEVNYIPLSALEISGMYVPPDADVSAAQTSSLQTREISNGINVEELFQFHLSDTVDVRVSDLSSVDFVMRNPNNGQPYLEYGRLCIDISPSAVVSGDNEVVVARKSIDFINEQGSDPYYQLHNFSTGAINGPDTYLKFWDQPYSGTDYSIGCETQFVVRVPDGNNGYEVKYMQLSAFQEHERVDSGTPLPRGRSVDYALYDEGVGCYQVLQLYGFDWGCSNFITSADISGEYGNSLLMRKWNQYGCYWQLDYMPFDSLDELAVKYVGDSQLSLSAHTPYSRSTAVWWDADDQKKYVELYGFQNDFGCDHIAIHGDGCTYYWPQDIRTDQTITENDYILVKHVDSNGNISLRYTQLEVQMPDLSSMEGDINNIYSEINSFYDDINYLSSSIDDLSTHLSGDYWEQGGDETVCYGYAIGDQWGCQVIDLENRELVGCWNCNGTFFANYFDVGCYISLGNTTIGHNNIHLDGHIDFVGGCSYLIDGYFYSNGTIAAGCGFYTGCAYLDPSTMRVGCSIIIGCTSIDESQLSALLQLASQAPQLLQNL